ncbi:MAG: ADP-ribosylation factor-like protein [Promethearchaeota archaeon]
MIINSFDKSVSIKIVYFGPALSGKTTSLRSLFTYLNKSDDIISIENTLNRTLFFDYGTLIFQNEKWDLKIHIYSTTGQDFYIVTRPTTLKGIDGLIFVADSQIEAYERNLTSWRELISYFGTSIENLPIIINFNKQDLKEKFKSMRFMNEINYKRLNNLGVEYTAAINGKGIIDSFEQVLKLIFQDFTNSQLLSNEGSYFLYV